MRTTLLWIAFAGFSGAAIGCGDVGYALARGTAAGLQGGSAAIQRQQAQPRSTYAAPAYTPIATPGCSNDYACAYGERCIKGQYAIEGVCAKAVDEYGVQTLSGPRATSVGVGEPGDCSFETDCPPMFACVKLEGDVLTGHCIKR